MGRIRWYCLPSVIRMSSMSSRRFRFFIVLRLARTTSVLPAAATSRLRLAPPPFTPRVMPLSLSTSAAPRNPSIR